MTDTLYKLPLDNQTDTDLIEWINSIPRNKKAEVVRHALRFYKSHLKEGEVFYYAPPSGSVPQDEESIESPQPIKQDIKKKKKPQAGLIMNMTRGREE
jgi:hypothetical protein